MIQGILAIWSLVPLLFLNSGWISGSSCTVRVLLNPGFENFEHYFTSLWDECNCAVVWACFGIAFLCDWNENWPFPVRYADDTTLMAESEEELKSLLMKVKEESKKRWLKAQHSENKDHGIWSHHFMGAISYPERWCCEVLHSICQQIWKTQQWPQDWKRSVFIPVPKKGNAKECSNYRTLTLISQASKVMLKILRN